LQGYIRNSPRFTFVSNRLAAASNHGSTTSLYDGSLSERRSKSHERVAPNLG
jgi:hypothetical protein